MVNTKNVKTYLFFCKYLLMSYLVCIRFRESGSEYTSLSLYNVEAIPLTLQQNKTPNSNMEFGVSYVS